MMLPNYFEKKQWIRMVLCVIVLLGISLYLSGVIGGEHLTYNLRTGSVKGTDAEASEKGFGGTVAVHAVLDGKKVVEELILPYSQGKVLYGLPDGSWILSSGGENILFGEAWMLSDGHEEKISGTGDVLQLPL